MSTSIYLTDEQIEQIENLIGDAVVDLDPDTFVKACVNTVLDEYIYPTAPIYAGDFPHGIALRLWKYKMDEGEMTGTARDRNLRPWYWLPKKTKEDFVRYLGELLDKGE